MATSSLTEAVFSLPGDDCRGIVALARDFTRRATATSGYLGSHEDVVLVVSELATDALHGGGRPLVRIVGGPEHLLVEVIDDSATRPDGWGLRLVDQLAKCWGVTERAGQNVVWCELTA